MITSDGRLLDRIIVRQFKNEIRVFGARLQKGESVAFLIDRETNKAHLNMPLDQCQQLAKFHRYELVVPQVHAEPPITHVERYLSLIARPTDETV